MTNQHLSLHDRLLTVLLERKIITEDDILKANEEQKKNSSKISDILVNMGRISRDDLTSILCEEFGCPSIDLSRFKISPDLIKLIPKKVAKQYKVIPVSKMGELLSVAMIDPLDVVAIDDMISLSGCNIRPVIASEKDIMNAIGEHYEGITHESIEQMVDGIKGGDIKILDSTGEGDVSSAELVRLTQEAPVIKITNMMLTEGVKLKASDILIEPLISEIRVRYRLDGILVDGSRLPKKIHHAVISRLKVMADLNIAERRLPQDGRFKIRFSNREVDFRVSILPSSSGEKAALRVLDKSQASLDLETLGFDEKSLTDLRATAARPHGMILVCGPTGCGKTTTLYSLLKLIDAPTKNIVTVEDPVEYQLYGINQVTIRPDIGLTFAGCLRSILRQDPDVIMVGEIRDFETVDIAIKSALTGHLVLSTLHTTTAAGSVVRMVNMGVEPFLITSSVMLVASQRLARKVCVKCKQQHKMDATLLKTFGLKGDVNIYRGKGCPECQNTGYKGRVGLIETLMLTPKVRELIVSRADEHSITEQAIKEGMQTLRMNAVKKMMDGTISPEEVIRLTVGDQDIPVE